MVNEGNYISDIVRRELDPGLFREEVIVDAGNLALGAVLGRKSIDCPETGTAVTGNTGNGTVDLVTAGPSAVTGTYTLVCIDDATDGGTFAVFAPDGSRLADAVVGTVYDQPQLGFTISDGTTDFALDDSFTIEVAEGSGHVVALDPDAVDGTQKAYGVLLVPCNATSVAQRSVAVTGYAVIRADNLVWPADITADQKAQALKELAARNIIDRKGV